MKRLFVLLFVLVSILSVHGKDLIAQQVDSSRVDRAIDLYNEGAVGEALDLLSEELNFDKKNGYAYFYFAYICERSSDEALGFNEEALNVVRSEMFLLDFYDKALKYIPKKDIEHRSLTLIYKAFLYRDLMDYDRSTKIFNKALKMGNDTRLATEIGQNYILSGEYNTAIDAFIFANNLEERALNYIGIAIAYINMEKYDEALEQLQKAINFDEKYVGAAAVQIARIYQNKGDYAAAVHPSIIAYLFERSDFAWDQLALSIKEEPELVIAKLKVALIEYPEEAALIKDLLARIYFKLGDKKNTVKYASEVLDIAPDNDYMNVLLLFSYQGLGKCNEALTYANNLLAQDSTNHYAYNFQMSIYECLGEFDKALESINKAIELSPKSPELYANRASLHRSQGRLDEAIDDYFIAMNLDSTISSWVLYHGVTLKQQGKNILAEEDFRKAIELDSIAGNTFSMAFAYAFLGEKEKAKWIC